MNSLWRTFFIAFAVTLQFTSSGSNFPKLGNRVVVRTSNSVYRHGVVSQEVGYSFVVTLDNGDHIEHSYDDRTAFVDDLAPTWMALGDHVIALSPKANKSKEYIIGFVTRDFCQGDNELYEITFDNNQRGNRTLKELRKLPFFSSTQQVGARVFARWTDKGYYRGFVKGTSYRSQVLYIDVQLDQSGSISHQASDKRAIILDIIPLYNHVHATQRVIGCFPGYTSYLPGWVVRRNTACWEAAYHVLFDMGKVRDQDFNEVRVLPPYVHV